MPVKRGEVYWVEFDPVRGSEQGGLRPALVVQNDVGNRYSPTTVVVAITRTSPPRPYPFAVMAESEESCLPERSVVNCAQMATSQQTDSASQLRPPRQESEVRPIGQTSSGKMNGIDEALRFNVALK